MTVTLYVAGDRWRARLRTRIDALAGLVPVIKGNGYGFGLERLAREASRVGVDTIAVGEAEEFGLVSPNFAGDIVVLAPWRPEFDKGSPGERVVRTVSHLDALRRLSEGAGRPRVVVELLTSMRRHGLLLDDLPEAAGLLGGVRFEGLSLHLPLKGDRLAEARALSAAARNRMAFDRLWVSHLAAADIALLRDSLPGVSVRLRSGTELWLGGGRDTHRVRATVLDVHRLSRGTTYGYWQRRMLHDGTLLVISGGTSHGVALSAPTATRSMAARGRALVTGGLDAAGLALSPFTVAGKKRWFAEPPHMQVSLVLLPASVAAPAIGDEVDLTLRMPTAYVDTVVEE
jgi:hypothetical protein